ncbi:MAG: Spy/CpxP family protein refolding chaperone [Woeseia sp.]
MKRQLTTLVTAAAFAVLANGSVMAQTDDTSPPRHAEGDHHGGDRSNMHRGKKGDRAGNPQHMVKRLQRALDLTDLQKQAIDNSLLAAKPEAEALRDASRANKKALRELATDAADYDLQLQTLSAERGQLEADRAKLHGRIRAEIDAQLTDEQRQRLDEIKSERKERGSKRRADRSSGKS